MKRRLRVSILMLVVIVIAPPAFGDDSESFCFAVFGDPQIKVGQGRRDQVFCTILDDISKHRPKPKFLVIVGDLVDGRSGRRRNKHCPPERYDPQYEQFFRILRGHLDPTIKFYPVAGNHDYHRDQGGAVRSGAGKYAEYMIPIVPEGAQPRNKPYYSFDYGNAHFAVITTGLLGYKEDWQDLIFGDQYEWLKQDLASVATAAATRHVFVFGHHQMYPVAGGQGARKELPVMQERIWKPLFVKYGVDAYIHGHWHFYDRSTHEGVAMIDVAGGDGREDAGYPQQNPNHYAIIEVSGARIQVSIYLLGGRLYERYDLEDLKAGRLPPPHESLLEPYRRYFPRESARTSALQGAGI